jgi:hypothetical protein
MLIDVLCWLIQKVQGLLLCVCVCVCVCVRACVRARARMYVKVKQSRYTPCRRLAERRYSSYSFTTSAVDGGEWSASRPSRALALWKGPPVPIGQENVWAPALVWTQRLEEKSFRLCRGSNLDRPVVQPVARHYTDWATLLSCMYVLGNLIPGPHFSSSRFWMRLHCARTPDSRRELWLGVFVLWITVAP